MIDLYTKNGLEEVNKCKNKNLAFTLVFDIFAVISLIFFAIFANYHTRILFSIISSVVTTVLVFFFIFFFSKLLFVKRIIFEYSYLLEARGEIIKCQILKCSDFLTTLPDKSRCYEVMVKFDNKEVIYYLSEIFDVNEIKEGNYKLKIANDYIKGYQYED